MNGVTTDLASRYGTPRRGRRLVVLGLVAVLAAAFLVWLAWAAWFHARPPVRSEYVSSEVTGPHEVKAVIEVVLDEDAEDPSCRVRAFAKDHVVVGELAFTPVDGRNEVVVQTEREATAVDLVGCTAKGQPRPQ
jgi:uncharacterized membrane protein